MWQRLLLVSLALLGTSACTTTLTHEQLAAGAQPAEPGFTYYLRVNGLQLPRSTNSRVARIIISYDLHSVETDPNFAQVDSGFG